MLAYDDAKPPDPDLTYEDYIRPYLLDSCGPIYEGFEFAIKSCRFRVAGTMPPSLDGDDYHVDRNTEIFTSGPTIERLILRFAKVLPFCDASLAAHSEATALEDSPANREAVVRAHFEHRSEPVQAAEEFATEDGSRYRVLQCEPTRGGIMPSTELCCEGPALTPCAECGAMAVRRCDAPGCKKLLCSVHVVEVSYHGAKRKLCPEHGSNDGKGCTLQ
eukprot:gnl/TRDRNA2_/TRDRNA2_156721_c4_seq3.p1 gnl/TRDRNA2_/TRDRNA2_156721_c4~~gnl/TRDRNA2_/TRDRNA2_156721_c4_seq3.p1  ORF type:complete len:218 (+),score=37.33 gnl/TRDRNA2_/TRDRNA2_156721_c4_seq3:148-801(+)